MSADEYLRGILAREAVDVSLASPVRKVAATLAPTLKQWGGEFLIDVSPSGSFAKGTANRSGTDIDLFLSISENCPNSLSEIYGSLFNAMGGYSPKKQNVSINVKVDGQDVDLVPAKRQNTWTYDHSLYRNRANTWTKTNIATHVAHVMASGRSAEIRVLKLWRNQKGLDFPSFYLEMTAITALAGKNLGLSGNVWEVFKYLRGSFVDTRVVDPANTNNVISDDLTATEKQRIKKAAESALAATDWGQIVT